MKTTIFTLLAILSLCPLSAQINQDTLRGKFTLRDYKQYTAEDTIPKVVYLKTDAPDNVLYTLDGQFVDQQAIATINPKGIEEVRVDKHKKVEDSFYEGTVHIITKEEYQPAFLTLNALKAKYTNIPTESPTLFLLDGKTLHGDYDELQVEEKYIMKIEVEEVDNLKAKLKLYILRLITRTEENLKEANRVYLKGISGSN